MKRTLRRLSAVLVLGFLAGLAPLPAAAAEADEIRLRDGLVLKPVGRYGRSALHLDALEAQIVAGKWAAPKAGDTVALPDGGTRTWEAATANKDGVFENQALGGGYAYLPVEMDGPRVMLLEASGHGMVYVNGEPRTGDPYQNGIVRLPVQLRKGTNDLLFHCVRGQLSARLVAVKTDAVLDARDATLPDLVTGSTEARWGAVVAGNATAHHLDGLFLLATRPDAPPSLTPLPPLPPLSTRKVGFVLEGRAPDKPGSVEVKLQLLRKEADGYRNLDSATVGLRVRRPEESRKVTFKSGIDGSIQYYAVLPARPGGAGAPAPALFLTLHGAAVEAIGQADAYSPKSWGHLVAPTNRRPFGFDWEDWGRLDALEVLDRAQEDLHTDPQRTYLTGHSMGGHGTWHLGAIYPDRFAAIGPSAGWISFWTYVGGKPPEQPTPMQEMLLRAVKPSDTLALARNYGQHGVYVLHGEADDNVPVAQARTMKEQLSAFHRDLAYHEQPKAGHWWDASDEPGADCVDWAPMFDFFARHALPPRDAVRQVDFVTANPGVSAWSHWACVAAQEKQLKPASVSLRCDPGKRRFVGTTDNVARLGLDLGHLKPGEPVEVQLDGQKLEAVPWPKAAARLWLKRVAEKWSPTEDDSALKGPQRYGPFKEAFRNRMVFVFGTRGGADENAWAYAKARFDAETFWYRGNGSVDLVADVDFDPAADRDRNVVLYGNADTNAGWKVLLEKSPVQVRNGKVTVGDRDEVGDDLACLFLWPRPGSDAASVGVVAGTGLVGMRLTDRMAYFVSGVGYPDCVVLGPEVLAQGSAGVRAAGVFGLDWSVTNGEFVWRK